MQAEPFQDLFRVRGQLLEFIERVLRLYEFDQLYFVELVLSDKPSRVLAV